jgi:hypothetical protein
MSEQLRALALAATPGPWLKEGHTIYTLVHFGWRKGVEQFKNRFWASVYKDVECPEEERQANVDFIAAANPAAILALLDEMAELRKDAEWRPIETAPKDGTLLICWVSAVCYGETDEGQQYQQDVSQVDFCSWRNGPPDLPEHGYFDPCCGQIGDSQDVTHWKPLPAPPDSAAKGESNA